MMTRVQVEFSLGWAEENPALFVKGVRNFQNEYANGLFNLSINLERKGFMTLIAKLKEQE